LGVGGQKDEKRAENYKKNLQENLNDIENYFLLDNSAFINRSNSITIADLICSCELEQPISVGFDFTLERPKLKDYLDRVRHHLGLHYEEAHKFSRILATKMKNEQALKFSKTGYYCIYYCSLAFCQGKSCSGALRSANGSSSGGNALTRIRMQLPGKNCGHILHTITHHNGESYNNPKTYKFDVSK
uniref:GST C-terminal domain-containing protein n=1 Tax=Romanomermis culicivorax TaxID=13658 RepID=A0A915L2D1_ROMCU